MQYTTLGSTGLQVSRLALGCMTYGDPARGSHPWTLPEDQSRPLIRQAVEAGARPPGDTLLTDGVPQPSPVLRQVPRV